MKLKYGDNNVVWEFMWVEIIEVGLKWVEIMEVIEVSL